MNRDHGAMIRVGARVAIVQKQDQRSGRTVEGVVAAVLTRSATHPHGLKVRLVDGRVGRVKAVLGDGNLPTTSNGSGLERKGRDG